MYRTAFQELRLWGGWCGRQANPDMQPEKTKNLEFIAIQKLDNLLHEVSLYGSHYEDDFSQRSQGFLNSLLPQPERTYWLNLRAHFVGLRCH